MATTTTTTATAIFEDSSMFMLPGMSSPEQPGSCSRVVRFDDECVVIPEASPRSKLPVVLTKSYSLPLWKKKAQHFSDSDAEDTIGASPRAPSPEDTRVTIRVPIPTFRRRSSRSPTPRGRSVSSSPIIPKTIPSCLVHRSPSVSANPAAITRSMPLAPVRRPSLPIYHRRKDEMTVPLRECCQGCERITEECIKEGESWQEKFSRGARRRRSSSLDHDDFSTTPLSSHLRGNGLNRGFTALSVEGANKDSTVLTSRYAASTSAFAITVDEVDKRRKSYDFSTEEIEYIRALSPPSPEASSSSQVFHSPGSPYSSSSSGPRYPRTRAQGSHDREVSSGSTVSSTSASDELLPDMFDPRSRLRSSPIEEEDEAQLFPLPRRSPSGTPSPKMSPTPSPSASSSCLSKARIIASPSSSSKESVTSKANSSQESILKGSLSRKVENGFLAAPAMSSSRSSSATSVPSKSSPSSSVSSTTKTTKAASRISMHGLNIPAAPTAEERASTIALSPKGPRPSPFSGLSRSSSARTSVNTGSRSSLSSSQLSPVPATPVSIDTSEKQSAPPNLSLSTDTASYQKPRDLTFPKPSNMSPTSSTFPKHAHSASQSSTGSMSPTSPHQRRKLSFTLPFIKAGGAIRDVGADVLKGVSSMSGGGVVGSV
ncbi:hypothetical protein B0H34DRAFT_793085 [Crassisporium funariophilum]|nr:hypothetical protein B0H34DRAFT_793085 [Crassisporium funariophilum]